MHNYTPTPSRVLQLKGEAFRGIPYPGLDYRGGLVLAGFWEALMKAANGFLSNGVRRALESRQPTKARYSTSSLVVRTGGGAGALL
jgi:hypothetical protein